MEDGWTLTYEGLSREDEGLREALCALGNGRFVTRGAAEEQVANGINYPGTYVAGGYNELASEVAGRTVVNEDLVNFPNWLPLTFRPIDGDWLDLWAMEVLEYRQTLDLQEGSLYRRMRIRDRDGRETLIESRRLVHMGVSALAGLEWRLTPENWSGEIIIRSGIDGSVTNNGVERYQQLAGKHLVVMDRGPIAPEGIFLAARTSQSRFEVAEAARTVVRRGDEPASEERRLVMDVPERISEEIRVHAKEGETLGIEKVVALHSSRDLGIGECGVAARLAIRRAPSFRELRRSQRAAWERLWYRCDLEIDADTSGERSIHDQFVLRLHIFHTLQTASRNTVGLDVGVPARGLHGEAYRGHIFWDELFILPFYLQRLPSVARSAILYRYHRLDAARSLAKEAGCVGAAFPWQSGCDGREATQQLHLNPMSGAWDPDHSHLQRHVSAAVVYNAWKYFEATGDRPFLESFGAELIVEVARFWASLATYDPARDRYDISGVMGPDEYHEKYPGAEAGGLKNNAYTNIMAVWCIQRAFDALDLVSRVRRAELLKGLGVDEQELSRLEDVSKKLTLVFHDGVLSQFEGYEDLEEFDWEGYAARYDRIERLDRILKAEGDTPDRYKVSKQADVIMLLYLFSTSEIREIVQRLGYDFDDEILERSVRYYQGRTSHGSTLSHVVYTSAVHRLDCDEGCALFLSALESDLYDVQGGTTKEGVHLGAMAGTVDIVMRHYAGLSLERGGVRFWPRIPRRIRRIAFRFQHHGRWFEADLLPTRLRLRVDDVDKTPISVIIRGRTHSLESGGAIDIDLGQPCA